MGLGFRCLFQTSLVPTLYLAGMLAVIIVQMVLVSVMVGYTVFHMMDDAYRTIYEKEQLMGAQIVSGVIHTKVTHFGDDASSIVHIINQVNRQVCFPQYSPAFCC